MRMDRRSCAGCVCADPRVIVCRRHLGARVEFVLRIDSDSVPPQADVECRPINSAGAAAETTIARFRFNEAGIVSEATVPELVNERLDQKNGAWSIVAAVLWNALQGQV